MDQVDEIRALQKNPILQTFEEYVVRWNALVTLANEAADVIVRLRSRVADLDQQTIDLMRGFKDCDDRRLAVVAEVERLREQQEAGWTLAMEHELCRSIIARYITQAGKRERCLSQVRRKRDEALKDCDLSLAQVAAALCAGVEWAFKQQTKPEEWPLSWEAGFPGLKAQALLDCARVIPEKARVLLDRLHELEEHQKHCEVTA